MLFPTQTLLSLLPCYLLTTSSFSSVIAQSTGKTTRYWNCYKASRGWTKKITLACGSNPVASCDKNDNKLTDYDAKFACDNGGLSFIPWAVSDSLAYGYAAATIAEGTESSWCCGCYELTFTSGPVSGKKMVVKVTNTGGDLGSNQFDIAIPGGGFGIFNACTPEYGTPSTGWGRQYGGVSSRSMCDAFPTPLKAGCYFRFDWFQGADDPSMTFQKVTCPAALTAKSGCVRSGETPTGAASSSTWTSGSSGQATASATSGSGSGATVPQYGQCDGTGWQGDTVCVTGAICTASGDYYSQCL